jgi:Ca-activated chloride channel family protein
MGRWFVLAAVLASGLSFAPPAGAQSTDTRNRAVIVLDASKSMNDDAGNGGTRLAAAKKAVGTLVDRLPEGVPLGLRVYGSKVSEASRAEGCRDTELTVPVGPLDKAALRGKVDALEGKGRTPIGNSLLAVPDDLGSAEGRRSVVLVTDGGDNCAPPSPCKAAEQVAKRGVDLSISVVGFQVNDRVRKQLRCIAEAGGGSYVDVDDADKLGDELLALLARAFRSYEPSGTKVTGGATREQAAGLGSGLFLDVLPQDNSERWYSIDVPEGRRAIVSATAIPPRDSSGPGAFQVKLFGPDSDRYLAFESKLLEDPGRHGIFGSTLTQNVRTRPGDPPGRYAVSVSLDATGGGFDTDVPVEIGVQLVKPGETLGMAREAGQLATPTPTPTATATAAKTSPVVRASEDSGALKGWLLVAGLGVLGIAIGLLAGAVLSRKAAA